MNELLSIVERLSKQSNPWILTVSIAVCAFIFWRTLRETLQQSHTITEKRLQLLLSYVDKDIRTQQRFSVEQAFAQHYRRPLTFDEISYCLAQDDSAAATQNYVWGYSHLKFNKQCKGPELREGRLPSKSLNTGIGTSSYVLATVTFAIAIAGAATNLLSSHVIGAAVALCIAAGSAFWVALMNKRSIEAAEYVLGLKQPTDAEAGTESPALPATSPNMSVSPHECEVVTG